MSFSYCTIEEAKRQLEIPSSMTAHDTLLNQLILAASASVKNYLGDKSAYLPDFDRDDEPVELDSNLEPVLSSFGDDDKSTQVRPEIKQAVLILVAMFFRDRDETGSFEGNYLPAPVRALLYPLRDPQTK